MLESALGVALGDNGQSPLCDPSKDNLCGRLLVLLRNGGDGGVLEQKRGIGGLLPAKLEEGRWAEGGVGGNGNALLLGQLDEGLLNKVWVVLDLENGRADLGISEKIQDQSALEVGNTDALCKLVVDQRLHSRPCLLDGRVAELVILLSVVGPSWWVADLRVDVFQGDWEVDVEEIEVVNAPVSELLAGNWLDLLLVVEAVPQLRDDEKVLALYQALLDGTGNTLASLNFVSVIYEVGLVCLVAKQNRGMEG